jgi:hypothetical protein
MLSFIYGSVQGAKHLFVEVENFCAVRKPERAAPVGVTRSTLLSRSLSPIAPISFLL